MDNVIYHIVMVILCEIGLKLPISIVDDYDPRYSIRNDGPHRLYTFHVEARDDLSDEQIANSFSVALARYRAVCDAAKPVLLQLDAYPGPHLNWSTVYLTVAVD